MRVWVVRQGDARDPSQTQAGAEAGILSPQKPVNLLPEVPMQQMRRLTDRETKDCEVIGKSLLTQLLDRIVVSSHLWIE